jgi:predicted DNA-binding protein
MLHIELPAELEQRLEAIGNTNGGHAADVARRVLLDFLEDLEDLEAAREAIREGGRTYSLEEVERILGLDDTV